MVDSNLQRENIKPSEKAFAYRMKLEAMKQQGKRNDLTFRQVGEKLANRLDTISNQHDMSLDFKNPTLETSKIEPFTNKNGEWGMQNVIRPERINCNSCPFTSSFSSMTRNQLIAFSIRIRSS